MVWRPIFDFKTKTETTGYETKSETMHELPRQDRNRKNLISRPPAQQAKNLLEQKCHQMKQAWKKFQI